MVALESPFQTPSFFKDCGVASEMVKQKPLDFSVMKNREAYEECLNIKLNIMEVLNAKPHSNLTF
jgi:hypothetical protein